MIPSNETNGTVMSSKSISEENTRAMMISEDAMAAIMDSLTNLYTNPLLAVIREYSTNALDAIKMAGKNTPVRVTLPGIFGNSLIVSDDGIGMSKSEILDHYAQYGASSKRNTNDQIGSFGFGCKSAFAISDQFTVTSVKNGKKVIALFSRSATGTGEAKILGEQDSQEDNGTQVSIPINNKYIHTIELTARSFFTFWDSNTVLLDGEDPSKINDLGMKHHGITILDWSYENVNIFLPSYNGRSFIRMGNVLYSFPSIDDNKFVIFEAEIGDIDITPNREASRLTEKTNKFINDTKEKFKESISKQILLEIAQAKNSYEVLLLKEKYGSLSSLVSLVNKNIFSFNNKIIESKITIDCDNDLILRLDSYGDYKRPNSNYYGQKSVTFNAQTTGTILLVKGVTEENARRVRRALTCVLEASNYSYGIIQRKTESFGWLEDGCPNTTILQAEDLLELAKEVRKNKPKDKVVSKRSQVTYECRNKDGLTYLPSSGLDSDIVVLSDSAILDRDFLFLGDKSDIQIVTLRRAQTKEMFFKRVPSAKDNMKELFLEFLEAKLPDPDILAEKFYSIKFAKDFCDNLNSNLVDLLCKDKKDFKDPVLKEIFTLVRDHVSEEDVRLINIVDYYLFLWKDNPAITLWQEKFQSHQLDYDVLKLENKYILLTAPTPYYYKDRKLKRVAEALIEYANAVYKKENG